MSRRPRPTDHFVEAGGVARDIPQLDLHGHHLEPALRRVTDFLEQHRSSNNSVQSAFGVRIITGSGSHGRDGPVLRNGVKRLLDNREMTYMLENPGSFLVQPDSGVVFDSEASSSSDTKIIVVAQDSEPLSPSLRTSSADVLSHMRATGPTLMGLPVAAGTFEAGLNGSSFAKEPLHAASIPQHIQSISWATPADTKREEEALAKAKLLSIEEEREIRRKEQKALEQAMRQSELLHAREKEEDEKLVQVALVRSQQEIRQASEEEEQLLKKALTLSKRQEEEEEAIAGMRESSILKEAIEASEREEEQKRREENREEEMLKRALEMSQNDSVQPNDDEMLRQIIELSAREHDEATRQDETLLQQALRESERYASM